MKKLKFLALGLLGASTLFLNSCQEDTTTAPDPNLSVVAFTTSHTGNKNEGFEVNSGTTIKFAINAAKVGGTDLSKFKVAISGANSITPIPATALGYNYTTGAQNLKNADDEVYQDTLTIDGIYLTNQGTNNFQFTVTDKNGQSQTVNITMTIKNDVILSNEIVGAFFHIGGSLQGAYDLVAAKPISTVGAGADPTKQDMKNTDQAGAVFTGSWTAGNATDFVKAGAGFDYSLVTEQAAATAYANGTVTANVNNPSSGDIYIAKLRGGPDYAVIKITSVDPNDNTCSCGNKGKITFSFKKKP